jgi:hypothetical protein
MLWRLRFKYARVSTRLQILRCQRWHYERVDITQHVALKPSAKHGNYS